MNKKNFFSVIIPTYNRIDLVLESINSVLNQTHSNYEIIIIDDASTDNSFSFLQKQYISNKKTKLFHTGKNMGVSFARNLGVEKSNYNWICFLDSDDLWESTKLEEYNIEIEKNSPDFIHSNEIWIRDNKTIKQPKQYKKNGDDFIFRSIKQCLISTSSVCIKKSLFIFFKGFNINLPVCEDYEFYLKILLSDNYNISFIENPLTIKRAGLSSQLSYSNHNLEIYRLKSLYYIYKSLSFNFKFIKFILKEINRKIPIVKNGAYKYNNTKIIRFIKNIEENIYEF